MLKTAGFKGIDAPAGPMTIVAFLATVPTVILWGKFGVSAPHPPESWRTRVWTGVPYGKYAVKEPKIGHNNQRD